MGWLDKKVALVTGGASGIGLAVVERFVAEGARVGIMDRTQAAIDAVVARLGADKVVGAVGDVRSLADNKSAVAATVAQFGQLDTFVGNAGIWDYMTPLVEHSEDKIAEICDEIFAVNVKGYILGAKAAVEELRKTGGSMIFTASTSSFYTGGGGPIYVASKHAVLGMIRQLAHELAPDIRVNGVAPGGTLTGLGGSAAGGQAEAKLSEIPDVDKLLESMTPLGFASLPADHAPAYLYLAAKEQSRFLTGTVINTDGGIGIGMKRQS